MLYTVINTTQQGGAPDACGPLTRNVMATEENPEDGRVDRCLLARHLE